MRNTTQAVESLESRRFLTSATLDVDESASTISAAGTVNGTPLSEKVGGSLIANIGGTVDVSYTRRGIKFEGSDLTATPQDSANSAAFSFQVTNLGPFLDVNDPNFDLLSRRINVRGTHFSTSRIEAGTSGSVAVTGLGTDVDLAGSTATLDYDVAHIKQSDDALRITVPFTFHVTGNYTLAGVPEALDVTFTGTIVARGAFASGQSVAAASASGPDHSDKDRVADSVLG